MEIMPTRMTLQLADRSITRPYGVIEDVLVRVKHLIFPADFIVMDIEEDADISLILGRPSMSTTSCVVDINGHPKMTGISASSSMSITTKPAGKIRCLTRTRTSSISP